MINNVQSFIVIYAIIIICVLLYNVAGIFIKDITTKSQKKKENFLRSKIELEIKRLSKENFIKTEHMHFIVEKLKHINGLILFNNIIVPKLEKPEVKRYLQQMKPAFIALVKEYEDKNNIKKTYFAYVISLCDFVSNEEDALSNFMIKNVTSKSLYLRESSLKALCSFGNAEKINRALEKMNRNNIAHSPRLITNVLLSFCGNHNKLVKVLFDSLRNFRGSYKTAINDYIVLSGGISRTF